MAISSALETFGWTKTADTGQVNWTSIASTPGANAVVYEIWKSADDKSATLPIYMKLEYGTGSSTAYQDMYITVGTGSTGAGALTGATSRFRVGANSSGGASNMYECCFSGTTSRFSFLMFRGVVYGSFFSVERNLDNSGNEQADYFTILVCAGVNNIPAWEQVIFPTTGGGPLAVENGFTSVQTNQASGAFVNSIAVSPIWPIVGKVDNPLLGAVCIKGGDFADGIRFTMNMYGASHTYVVSKTMSNILAVTRTATANNGIGMRFE
jgi:hypothetical protein